MTYEFGRRREPNKYNQIGKKLQGARLSPLRLKRVEIHCEILKSVVWDRDNVVKRICAIQRTIAFEYNVHIGAIICQITWKTVEQSETYTKPIPKDELGLI